MELFTSTQNHCTKSASKFTTKVLSHSLFFSKRCASDPTLSHLRAVPGSHAGCTLAQSISTIYFTTFSERITGLSMGIGNIFLFHQVCRCIKIKHTGGISLGILPKLVDSDVLSNYIFGNFPPKLHAATLDSFLKP